MPTDVGRAFDGSLDLWTHGSPELDEDARKLEAMGADPGPVMCRTCWGIGFIPMGKHGWHMVCEDCGHDPVEF